MQPSPLNEKVLKEKRKKLKETFDRVMRLMQEEEPEFWSEIKRKEVEYEKRRYKRVQYYESVRHAEQVSIEDIPLPSSTNEKPIPATMPKINLPPPVLLTNVPAPSTQRKPEDLHSEKSQDGKEKEPPGIPASIPPNLFEMRELDSDYESDGKEEVDEDSGKEESSKDKHDKNIEEFMKEVESAQRKKEEERTTVVTEIKVNPTPDVELEEKSDISEETHKVPEEIIPIPSQPQQQPHIPIGLPRMPPHAIQHMFRPPPMRPGLPIGIRMPPGPPPAHLRPPNVGMPRMGIRMAPGPPPRHKHHHDRNAPPKQTTTTITAKPQIRNLSADVTRFVPTTLRAAKRDEPRRVKPKPYMQEMAHMQPAAGHAQQPSKDDALKQFMEELGELL